MTCQYVCKNVVASDLADVVSFHLSDVPEYLRGTDFYFSLEDDGKEITLPKQFFKENLSVSSPADAHDLLSTMRFWGVEKIPSQLITYVATCSHLELNGLLSEFTSELKNVNFLRLLNLELHHIRPSTWDRIIFWYLQKRMKSTTESVVSILAVQFQRERGRIWNTRSTAAAAEIGWLDCLIFLHEMGCPWDASTCTAATTYGHIDCLKYAHKHGCPWDAQTVTKALKYRHIHCYQYARAHGCPGDTTTCSAAAGYGDLALLKSLYENGCPWDETTCEEAARSGSLACLQYARTNGCPWNAATCAAAADAGNLAALTYAHTQGCPWDVRTCVAAARHRISACLMYAHKNGCPWDKEVVKTAVSFKSIECLRYALEHGCPGRDVACESAYDSLVCLKYLREEQKCPWDSRILDRFARALIAGTDCLQYCLAQGCMVDAKTMLLASHCLDRMKVLRRNKCPWDKRTMHAVAEAGDLKKLQYCFENGCPGREDVALAAAPFLPLLQYLHGQGCPLPPEVYERALQAERPIECVRFLYETGVCPWPKQACTWFVQHRRMDCLVYARTHGAPWDTDTCAAAAHTKGRREDEQRCALDFLRYLREEGCPWDTNTVLTAQARGNTFCLQYALEQGCPSMEGHIDVDKDVDTACRSVGVADNLSNDGTSSANQNRANRKRTRKETVLVSTDNCSNGVGGCSAGADVSAHQKVKKRKPSIAKLRRSTRTAVLLAARARQSSGKRKRAVGTM